MYNDNQLQWYSYLRGILTDETRIDSPEAADQRTWRLIRGTLFARHGRVLTGENPEYAQATTKNSFDTAIVGDILAIMLICYQVINYIKISFSGDVRGLKSTNMVGD